MAPFYRFLEIELDGKGGSKIKNQSSSFAHSIKHEKPQPEALIRVFLKEAKDAIERNFLLATLKNREKEFATENAEFVFKWLVSLVNQLMLNVKKEPTQRYNDNVEATFLQFSQGPPVNAVISLTVDQRITELWQRLDSNQFIKVNETTWVTKQEFYSEQGPTPENALGIEFRFVAGGNRKKIADLARFFGPECSDVLRELIKTITIDVPGESTKVDWLKLDHYVLFEVSVAPYDRLPSQQLIQYKKMRRRKLVPVSSLANKNHVVYIATDSEEKVRYIGEGKPTRPKHVNSGISSVYEFNMEHFKGRKMSVRYYADNLTKSEALTIEKLLLEMYAHCSLWNKTPCPCGSGKKFRDCFGPEAQLTEQSGGSS